MIATNNDIQIRKKSDIQLYNECSECRTWSFGHFDIYCSKCGTKLDDSCQIASIRDYAKNILLEFLNNFPDLAMEADISEIPDYATEAIRANGNVLFNQYATRHILVECWNEVEIALDDWKEGSGMDFPASNIERLHVFSISQHAEMIWRSIISDIQDNKLNDETIADAIDQLRH